MLTNTEAREALSYVQLNNELRRTNKEVVEENMRLRAILCALVRKKSAQVVGQNIDKSELVLEMGDKARRNYQIIDNGEYITIARKQS